MTEQKQCGCTCCMERRLRDAKWEALKEGTGKYGNHPGSVVYADTDSIHVTDGKEQRDRIIETALESLRLRLEATEEKLAAAERQADALLHTVVTICRTL